MAKAPIKPITFMKPSYLLTTALAAAFTFGASGAEKLTGTPISSETNINYGVDKLFDGRTETYCWTSANQYGYVGMDFGEPYIIKSITYTPYELSNGRQKVVLGLFQGANKEDFTDAVPIHLITEAPKTTAPVTVDINVSRGFRYVRYVGNADSHCMMAELEFSGEKGAGDDSHLYQVTNLPTVVVNTLNSEAPYDKEHEIQGSILIISDNGATLSDHPGGIRERGNGSRAFPKKPWRIKYEKKQNVLDAPAKAKKWTLLNNYGDKTLMRNMLAFAVARKFNMEYVPYIQPVDVILNGEYKGTYTLCDQVEVAKDRVNIQEMETTDVSGDALTGGYFIEIDAYASSEISWFTSGHYNIPVTIKSPDDDKITPEQSAYIENYFNQLETAVKSTGSYDASDPVTGYRRMFDSQSFLKHMLVNEVASNTDTYWSTYMYKHRNDPKFYTGPVWDFDLGFENDQRTHPVIENAGDGYLWYSGKASSANGVNYFVKRIVFSDETTAAEIHDIWKTARQAGLSAEWLKGLVDEYAAMLDASQKLNFTRWPILNERVHENYQALGSYEAECDVIRDYVAKRIPHLDGVIGLDPSELEDTSIGEVAGEKISVNVYGNTIVVMGADADAPLAVYSADGRRVFSGRCASSVSGLESGLYIVRADSGTHKVIVK